MVGMHQCELSLSIGVYVSFTLMSLFLLLVLQLLALLFGCGWDPLTSWLPMTTSCPFLLPSSPFTRPSVMQYNQFVCWEWGYPPWYTCCWWGLWAGLEWIRQFDWPEVGFVRWQWGVNNVTVVGVKSIKIDGFVITPLFCTIHCVISGGLNSLWNQWRRALRIQTLRVPCPW